MVHPLPSAVRRSGSGQFLVFFGALLATLLLALAAPRARAATPLLRLEATVAATNTDVTAFVDQVEIVDATTGLPVRNAVLNAGFETSGALGNGSYGYTPGGGSWTFVSHSGIAGNGSAFGIGTAPEGTRVAFLQTTSTGSGYFSQTLPDLGPGLYRVRLRVSQRNTSPANQGVRVRVDGVDLGTVTPGTGGYTMYNSAPFAVARPSTSGIFTGGASLTTNGSTALNAGTEITPVVTDVDGDGLLDLLVGRYEGTVLRFEQTTAGGGVFAAAGALTTDGSTVISTGNASYLAPAVTDVDGDGLLDLLVCSSAGGVRRYEQTVANGSNFGPQPALTTDGTNGLGGVGYGRPTVTDVDGDGRLDLLVGTLSRNVLRFEQTAAGASSFAPLGALTADGTTTLDMGTFPTPAVTDLDGDGRLDLLMGEGFGTMQRYEQTAVNAATFALVGTLTSNGTATIDVGGEAAPAVTDVDGDGLLDLLVGEAYGTVRRYEQAAPPTALALSPQAVAENAASGTVVGTFTTTDATPGDTFTYSLVAGTGSTDNASFAIGTGANAGKLLTAAVFDFETQSSYSVRVRVTDATGNTFDQSFTISITDVAELPSITSFVPASGPLGTLVTITGQNLSGLTSVLLGEVPVPFTVVSNTSVTLTVPRQATSQKLRISRTSGPAGSQGSALSATAFTVTRPLANGVLVGGANLTTDGTTAVYENLYAKPAVTDIDGDGRLDLLVGHFLGVARYEQSAVNSLTLPDAGNITTNGSASGRLTNDAGPAVTDLDGDGLLDLLTGNDNGNVLRYEQTTPGGAIFALVGNVTTDGTTVIDVDYDAATALTDLDGDGLLDLLVGSGNGDVGRFEQTAANGGIFASLGNLTTTTTTVYAGSSAVPTVTDLDGDNLLDLLVGSSSGNVRRFEQTAANSSQFTNLGNLVANGSTTLSGSLNAAPTVTDLDGDGLLDLLVGTFDGFVRRYELTAPPTALALAPQAVAENAASGTVVGTFTTTDATPGDTFTYSLVAGTGSTDNASFAIGTGANAGKLVTAAVFNYEAKSSYSVRVRTTDATGITFDQSFTISIIDLPDSPSITSFSPNNGPVGTVVTLTGSNFTGATAVAVNGTAGSITANTGTSLTFTVAAGSTTGLITLTTPNGPASAPGGVFTVVQPPTLTGLSAAAELPGQAVVLTGTGFTSSSTVRFGGVAAASVTYTSSTSLTAVVPVGAAAGSSAVVLTNAAGSTPSSPAFEVLRVYRSTAASGCLTTVPLTVSGTGGASVWRYLRLPDAQGGAVVAAIEDTRNLGSVTVGVLALGTGTSAAVRQDGAGRRYLDRNFYLTATNQAFPGQSVRVRFFGLSSELTRLQAVDANATPAGLKVSQYSGPNEDCDLSNNGTPTDQRLLSAPATTVSGADWFTAEASVADHFSEFYLSGASSPLPVELTQFTATAEGGAAVRLAWTTAQEKNSAAFEVERSPDGRQFASIGTVVAAGNSAVTSHYSLLDARLPAATATLYYRLRQVDRDGSSSFSPVRVVELRGAATALSLYPNPTTSEATLINAQPGSLVTMLDALGRVVLSATADTTGTVVLVLPRGLSQGMYIVQVGTKALRLAVE